MGLPDVSTFVATTVSKHSGGAGALMGVLERAEFATWYRELHPRVLAALTIAAGSSEVAADATAEAFLRAYERWDRVRVMASPGGWLYQVGLNTVRRRARRLLREHDVLQRAVGRESSAPAALQPEVWDAVRALPARQRAAVALRYVLDLPEAEVGALMGVTRGAVSSYLTTARRTLATSLAIEIEESHHG